MTKTKLAVMAAALALAGCAGAPIELPRGLSPETQALRLTGMGGFGSGRFQLAGGTGTFSRSLGSSSSLDGLRTHRRGSGRFRFDAAPGVALAGDCRLYERDLNIGPFQLNDRPFSYHCDLRRGAAVGQLVIEAQPGDTLETFGREARIGFVELDGTRLSIRSIHPVAQGNAAPAMSPLGYRFDANGRAVGAVDLNAAKTIYAPPPPGRERDAVVAASLALAVLWDPARM